jgi:hypothetical protein
MDTSGPRRNPKANPVPTEETVHWTVRVLLGIGLRECAALKKYATRIENGTSAIWSLYSRKNVETAIRLPEDKFSGLEGDLLESWIQAEGGENGKAAYAVFSEGN